MECGSRAAAFLVSDLFFQPLQREACRFDPMPRTFYSTRGLGAFVREFSSLAGRRPVTVWMRAMASRPNIVLMISHDLGCHIGPYGWATEESRCLNQFAAEGICWERHFVTSPGCSQSRASLVTGRYPHANGQFGLAHWGWRLYPDEVLLPQVLGNAGYDTRLFGVWHLDPWTLEAFGEVSPNASTRDATAEGPAQIGSERAAEWLSEPARKSRPFYLHLGFWEVHRPFCGDPEQEQRAQALAQGRIQVPPYLPTNPPTHRDLAELHASVERVDQGVGTILDALEANGLAEDTLVVFTADHGLPFPRAKGTLYDPGIQVAFLARLPGRIAPGQRRAELSSNIDVMPTLLEAAGQVPPDRIQGRSRWAEMLDPAASGADSEAKIFAEKTYHEHYDPIRCVRTERYKYIRNFEDRPRLVLPTDVFLSPTRVSIADDESIWGRRPREELYDLREDPAERVNRIDDPGFAATRDALRNELESWMRRTGDPLLEGPILRQAEQVQRLGGYDKE